MGNVISRLWVAQPILLCLTVTMRRQNPGGNGAIKSRSVHKVSTPGYAKRHPNIHEASIRLVLQMPNVKAIMKCQILRHCDITAHVAIIVNRAKLYVVSNFHHFFCWGQIIKEPLLKPLNWTNDNPVHCVNLLHNIVAMTHTWSNKISMIH